MSPRGRGFPLRATSAPEMACRPRRSAASGRRDRSVRRWRSSLGSHGVADAEHNIEHMAWQFCTAKAPQSRSVRFTLIRRSRGALLGLETGARPGDLNHGAVIGKSPVGKGNLGAGPFQRGTGDEHAKPEAGAVAVSFVEAAAP